MSDSIFPALGAIGSTGSGAFSSSTLSSDVGGGFVGLPGGSSALDILGDQSSLGTGVGNPSTAASAVGTTTGTNDTNSLTNPGGTNPGGSGSSGFFTQLQAWFTSHGANILAIVLGVVFIIIGAVGLSKSAGVSLPVE